MFMPAACLRAGATFNASGAPGIVCNWIIERLVWLENAGFRWAEVWAKWTGFGPMPNWHQEEHRFIFNRQSKATGDYT